ncbi:hypothetical protein PCANC_23320 [Puccinia coronata f. sp. avenae]|uniref:Uncharacterized protein n=1 Tax=Puccinia coronata f. sp. avenae TaxID=200324 RepID=A0A2N5TU08_9BASI|nr:hypothetical protein PCANC_23320 [Puccinia coronata f. sp. avenae]
MIHSIDLLIQDQSPAIFKLSDFVPKVYYLALFQRQQNTHHHHQPLLLPCHPPWRISVTRNNGGHIPRSHNPTSTTPIYRTSPFTRIYPLTSNPDPSIYLSICSSDLYKYLTLRQLYLPLDSFIPEIEELTETKVTPTETTQLVQYWINRLTRKKNEYVASLEPSPYDLLPYKAKLLIALRRIKEQKDLDLEYHITFNNLVRSHAKTRRQQYLERMNPPVTTPFLTTANSGSLTTNVPSANPSRLVPNYASKDNVPATDSNIEEIEANEDFLDYDLDNPNSQDSSLPQQDHAKETVNSTTNLAARVKAMTLPRIKRVDPPKEQLLAMEIDQSPISSGAIHSPPTSKDDDLVIITHHEPTDKITQLSKTDQIRVMVKDHVAIHARFLQAQKDNNSTDMKTLLTRAQENQKSLQKLIPNPEIESYVKGWNPWDAKRTLFPPQAKREREGKPKSSAYRRMKYDDQDTWAKVADIASAVRSLYKATKRG